MPDALHATDHLQDVLGHGPGELDALSAFQQPIQSVLGSTERLDRDHDGEVHAAISVWTRFNAVAATAWAACRSSSRVGMVATRYPSPEVAGHRPTSAACRMKALARSRYSSATPSARASRHSARISSTGSPFTARPELRRDSATQSPRDR